MLQMERDRVYIEYCTGCAKHQWCTNHNEAKYLRYFSDCRTAILRDNPGVQVTGNDLPPWLVKKFVTDEDQRTFGKLFFPRTGAFEVHFNRLVLFSKLESGLWPHPELLGKKVAEVIEASRQPPPEKPPRVKYEANTTTKKKRKKRKKRTRKSRSPSAKVKRSDQAGQAPRYLFENAEFNRRPPSPPTKTSDNPRSLFDADPSFNKFEAVGQPVYMTDSFEVKKDPQDASGFIDNFGGDKHSKASSHSSGSSRKFKFPDSSLQEGHVKHKSYPEKSSEDEYGEDQSDKYSDEEHKSEGYSDNDKGHSDKYSDDDKGHSDKYSDDDKGHSDKYSDDDKGHSDKYSDDDKGYSDKYSDDDKGKEDSEGYSDDDRGHSAQAKPVRKSSDSSSSQEDKKADSEDSYKDEEGYESDNYDDSQAARKPAKSDEEADYDDEYGDSEKEEESSSSSSDDSLQITKSFGLSLPVGEMSNKVRPMQKITYQNKSGETCEFILTSTKPALMVPKEERVKIKAGEKGKFQLRFMPVPEACEKKLLLKVESNGQLWEVIEIKATYE
jgi:hypothetical protein